MQNLKFKQEKRKGQSKVETHKKKIIFVEALSKTRMNKNYSYLNRRTRLKTKERKYKKAKQKQ